MDIDADRWMVGAEREVYQVTTPTAPEAALQALFGTPDQGGVFSGGVSREKSARVKYWRKPESAADDSGWITTGPDWQTDAPKAQQFSQMKKFKELPDSFGKEVDGLRTSTIAPNKPHSIGNEHRWLQKFMENGGLTYVIRENDGFGTPGTYLMPARQIVALGLHRDQRVKEARPDLKEVVDLECDYACLDRMNRRRLFSGVTLAEAQRNLDQHLTSHKEALASRAVGNEIAKALTMGGITPQGGTDIAAIVAAVVAALNPQAPAPAPQPAPVLEPVGMFDGSAVEEEPVTVVAALEPEAAFEIDTASRQDMMAFAKTMGIPPHPLGFKATTEDMRAYLREVFALQNATHGVGNTP